MKETNEGGMLFELTHRNQFKTDRKEDRIVFHIINMKLAEKFV